MPRSNGQVERVNRFLRSILAKLSSDADWAKALSKAEFSINNSLHSSIGTTPSILLFGAEQYGFADDDLRNYLQSLQETPDDREKLRDSAIIRNRNVQEPVQSDSEDVEESESQ
ncbi:hypothetical protein KPH14_012859 [Odynerus spinipes]|uniref:Integrase catalytic domain-containing protein n=1 Tax=Odynerus spinipes TaxID=1348599 RepID=A0AAD9VK50_9HYME|nr:hypothetical protein KPH14_012859 [Odynerus spinipes]